MIMENIMEMREPDWHSGPPPEIGWWPASTDRDKSRLRWWNDEYWSKFATCTDTPRLAAFYAAQKDADQENIQWAERWWV